MGKDTRLSENYENCKSFPTQKFCCIQYCNIISSLLAVYIILWLSIVLYRFLQFRSVSISISKFIGLISSTRLLNYLILISWYCNLNTDCHKIFNNLMFLIVIWSIDTTLFIKLTWHLRLVDDEVQAINLRNSARVILLLEEYSSFCSENGS